MDIIDPFSLTDDDLLAMFPAWPDVWQQVNETAPVETEAAAPAQTTDYSSVEGKSTHDLMEILS